MIPQGARSVRFAPSVLLPDFRVQTLNLSVGTTAGRILGSNPDRVTLLFTPRSVGTYIVGPTNQITTGQGFQVNFNNSPLVFDFATYGHLLTGEWFAVSTAGPFNAIVFEVSYQPVGD